MILSKDLVSTGCRRRRLFFS